MGAFAGVREGVLPPYRLTAAAISGPPCAAVGDVVGPLVRRVCWLFRNALIPHEISPLLAYHLRSRAVKSQPLRGLTPAKTSPDLTSIAQRVQISEGTPENADSEPFTSASG